jgi:uncharacterized Tic20 family protein
MSTMLFIIKLLGKMLTIFCIIFITMAVQDKKDENNIIKKFTKEEQNKEIKAQLICSLVFTVILFIGYYSFI